MNVDPSEREDRLALEEDEVVRRPEQALQPVGKGGEGIGREGRGIEQRRKTGHQKYLKRANGPRA